MARTMVVFDDRSRSFRCAGCLGEPYEVRASTMKNPEEFTEMRERIELEHAECPDYSDSRLALNARRMKMRVAKEMAALRQRRDQPWGSMGFSANSSQGGGR